MTDIKVGDTVQQTCQVEGVVTAVGAGWFELGDRGTYSNSDDREYMRWPYRDTKVLKRAVPPKPTVVGTLVRYTALDGLSFLYVLHADGLLHRLNRSGSIEWEVFSGYDGTTEIVHVPGDSDG